MRPESVNEEIRDFFDVPRPRLFILAILVGVVFLSLGLLVLANDYTIVGLILSSIGVLTVLLLPPMSLPVPGINQFVAPERYYSVLNYDRAMNKFKIVLTQLLSESIATRV